MYLYIKTVRSWITFFLLINSYKKQLARKTTVNQLYQVYDKFDDAFNLEALGLAIWYVINVEHV